MNQTWPRKTLSLNFRNRNNVKIYDLEDDFKAEKKIEEPDVKEVSESNEISDIVNDEALNHEENQDFQELIPHKKLFKKTLSRIVFVQLIDSILSNDDLKNEISTANLIAKFPDLMGFISENNFHECSFLRNKQLSNNFIHDLFLTFNQNYFQIEQSVKESCKNHWEIYINEAIHSSIICCAIAEFLYMEAKNSEKDYKKIILNEYLLISEYFLNENEMKFVNGILNTIFYKSVEKSEEIEEIIDQNQNESQIDNHINEEIID